MCFDRSNHRMCSIKKRVLKNFAKFTGKHLCQSLFLNKVSALRPATLRNFYKHLFYRGSRTVATSKMERFVLILAVNYYHKALHLGCCSCPRSASVFYRTHPDDCFCFEALFV